MGQIGKFNADGDQKAYAQENLQLLSYPTVLFFPKNSSQIIKYPSENREVDALLGFVQALQ
jgi:adenylyl-sulfate reductase (glutathione)